MATETNLPFSWEQVDKLSDLRRLELVLHAFLPFQTPSPDCHLDCRARDFLPVI